MLATSHSHSFIRPRALCYLNDLQGFALSATDCGGECPGLKDATLAFTIIASLMYLPEMASVPSLIIKNTLHLQHTCASTL